MRWEFIAGFWAEEWGDLIQVLQDYPDCKLENKLQGVRLGDQLGVYGHTSELEQRQWLPSKERNVCPENCTSVAGRKNSSRGSLPTGSDFRSVLLVISYSVQGWGRIPQFRTSLWCSGWDSALPMPDAQVRSLVGELRSHMLNSVAKKKTNHRPETPDLKSIVLIPPILIHSHQGSF